MNVRSDLAMAYHMGYEDALAKRMPDATKAGVLNSYIRTNSERTGTCHDTGTYCFSCSECGWTANEPHHLFGGFQPNYCPNCGRRCVG